MLLNLTKNHRPDNDKIYLYIKDTVKSKFNQINRLENFIKNFMAPFYGWGSTTSRLEPLQKGSLLFTTKFPEIPGTHCINLGRMKG